MPLVAQDPKSWPDQQRDSQATIRVTADLVLVPVTVTESSGRPVLGLEKRDFVLTDDKVAQEILSFSREIAPVSIGIVFDQREHVEQDWEGTHGRTRIPSVPRNWG